jgi:hypothetical protein
MNRYLIANQVYNEYLAECLTVDGEYTLTFREWLEVKSTEFELALFKGQTK